jgi:predicted P-loop ATPase
MEARRTGIDCRDRDVNRFVYSKEVKEYHPFRQYMERLPEWDGKDRVSDLARRVSSEPLWVEGFHRWMLALASQWMGSNRMHANSLAPILVSERQGCQKSTFCKSLMPSSLVRYYTDSVDLSASTQMEQKLGLFGLINLDEFDRLPDRKMALLKNWMQMAGMNVRKAHAKHFHPLPRLASFIGTTNQKNLLSDPTGSRRFLCVEVQSKINCEGIEHDQIYAQLKDELQKGERHWFTSGEEEAIMRSNEAFYKRPIEEDVFHACFRAACPGNLNVNAAVKPMSSKSSLALKSSLQLLICQHGDDRFSIRGQVRVRTREQGGDQMIHLFQG